jgi:hypothetical protein
MTHRELTRPEWDRLPAGCELAQIAAMLPDTVRLYVVEDHDEIVGAWALVLMAHAEGLWIAEPHRKHAAVLRHLMAAISVGAVEFGVSAVVAGSDSHEMTSLLKHGGARPLGFPCYLWPLPSRKSSTLPESDPCQFPS